MRRALTLVVITLTAMSACSVREDALPRVIPPDERDELDGEVTGEEAEGASRIYLLGPVGDDGLVQLRSVARNAPPGPDRLLEFLLLGANGDEVAAGLSSALPTDLEIISARTVGTRLTIDVNDALNELSDDGLRQALAQIVATSGEVGQVQQVRIRVNGENQAWPTGDGEVTDQPLSIYDYPGFLETSQPPFPALPASPT